MVQRIVTVEQGFQVNGTAIANPLTALFARLILKPHNDKYDYPQPEFTFQETVAMRGQYEECSRLAQLEELDYFRICALELVEYITDRRLQSPPTWLYGIRYARGTRELMWFESDELISIRDIEQTIEL